MKSKRFFFLFIFLIGSCSIFYLPCPVSAEETENDITQSLIASNLQFGITLPGADSNTHVDIGGKKVTQFTKLPSLQAEDGKTIFRGRLRFQVEANFYTTYSAVDTFPKGKYINRNIRWLDLYTAPDPNFMLTKWSYAGFSASYKEYDPTGSATISLAPSFNYDTFQYAAQHTGPVFPVINYPSIDSNTILSSDRAPGFIGDAVLTVDFVDLIPDNITLNDELIIIQTDTFDGDIIETSIMQSTAQAIGEYDVQFVGDNEAEVSAYDISQPDPSITGDIAAQNDLAGQISRLDLGVHRTLPIDDMQVYPYLKAQQGEKHCPTGVKSGTFYLKLRPDVLVYHETLDVNYQLLVIDNIAGFLSPVGIMLEYSSGVIQKTIERVAGFKTTNYLIHTNWEVLVDVYATTQIAYDEAYDSSGLNYALYELENMYFDSLLYGDTAFRLPYEPDPIQDFLDQLWQDYWWILLIAGIAVVIYLFFIMGGPMLLQQAAMQRSMRTMRKTVGGHPRDS